VLTHSINCFVLSGRKRAAQFATLLLCCCLSLLNEAQEINFHKVTLDARKPLTDNYLEVKENNLSLPKVLTFYQSIDQTVWMGTEADGLIAYAGNYTKHYRHEPGNPKSLPGNTVYDVWEESPTILWLSTGSGLIKYNRLCDSFIRVSNNGVFVCKNKNGQLLTTVPGQGLQLIDTLRRRLISFGEQRVVHPDGTQYPGETMTFINRLAVDADGDVWAAGKAKTVEGLFRFEAGSHHWVFYQPPSVYLTDFKKGLKPITTPGSRLGAATLYIDSTNRIWWGGWSFQGLMCYEKKTGQWHQYYFEASPHHTGYNAVLHIYPINNDAFWLSTDLNCFVFNHRLLTADNYTWLEGQQQVASFKTAESGFVDHCNNRWLYTNKGVFKTNRNQTGFQPQMRLPVFHSRLSAFCELDTGHYLLSDLQISLESEHSRSYITEIKQGITRRLDCSIPRRSVHEIIPAGKDSYYIIGAGIYRFSLKKGTARRITLWMDDGSKWYNGIELFRNILWNDSTLFSCSRVGPQGLLKINPKSGKVHRYNSTSKKPSPDAPFDDNILRIMQDNDNRIWCSTGNGVDIFCPEKEIFEHYSESEDGLSLGHLPRLCKTANGQFYIASEAGVFSASAVPGRKASFTYLTNVGVCYWATTDKNGLPWVGTPQGVFRIDPATKTARRFTEKEGWYWNPLSEPKRMNDGRFVLYDGAVIDPTAFAQNKFVPRPSLTKFLVAGQPFTLDTALPFKRHIFLKNDQNFFSISYTCNSYINEEGNTYTYKLEGADNNWVAAGTRTEAFYTALVPGTYRFWVQAANSDGLRGKAYQLLTITIVPIWYQTGWFKAAAMILLLVVVYTFYRQHLLKERAKVLAEKHRAIAKQQEAEVKQMKAEFEKQLAQTEMAALRSQMNPHFIFNCLNSIKLYTLQNNTEAATEYLSKFSRLIRLVLENSRTTTIPLDAELEYLRLYLDMEVMRFKQKLHYTLSVAPGVDTSFVEIPPLLLQPYVENAIWHGLMHKAEGGQIDIHLSLQEESWLVITITDNGIGRTKAAELKSKGATAKKSFGMKVTSERIALIKKLYQTDTEISVLDLVDNEGQPAGTEVTIKIHLHDNAAHPDRG